MLDTELQLLQLAKVLEVLGLSNATLVVLDGLQEITKDRVRKLAIAITAKVACSLVNILGSPERTIRNINVDRQASAWLTNRRLGLYSDQSWPRKSKVWYLHCRDESTSIRPS
jgi:hypothetical protein